MTAKHTSGPWMIRAERYRFIHVYAHVGGIAHLDTIDAEGAANARLIAAAPDMLEALKEAAHFIEKENFAIGWNLDRLREVIAKAERIDED